QNALDNVDRALEQKDAWLAQREAEFKESSERLQAQLSDFQNQLTERQQQLEVKDKDLSQAAGQIGELEKRIVELESLSAEAQAVAGAAAERVRQESQAALEALQASLREKEQELQQHYGVTAEREANFNGQIEDLRKQLSHKQDLLDRRDQEYHTLVSETAALHERIAQLESAASEAEKLFAAEAERIRSDLQAELGALRAQLNGKDLELAASQLLVQESEKRLQAQIYDLQIQISEKQLLLEAHNIEVAGLQGKVTALSEELAQVEAGKGAVEAAASDAEIACRRYEEELGAQQEKLKNLERLLAEGEAQSNGLRHTFNAQLGDLQRELAEKQGLLDTRSREIGELTAKTSDLQEQITCLELANKQTVKEAKAAARTLEDSLHVRIQELEAAVTEKAQGLQNRTRELESAQSESAVLQQRIEQLEQTQAQAEEAKNEANRTREGLQNALDNVDRALEQKDAWLAQREAEFKESSERLQAQLSDFQNQLTEKHDALETQTNELLSARSEITALANRIRELESAKAAAETNAITGMDRLREQFQLELADLRTELEQRKLALEEGQITIRTLEGKLNSEKHRLETLAAEKQTLLDRSHLQLEEKGSEIATLQEELARSEFARRQTEMRATTETEQIRECVNAEVAALDAKLRERENALKSLANRGQELELKLLDLRQQLAQKESLIQSRDIEAKDLGIQAGDLLAQITHLESAHKAALEQQRVAAGQLEQNLRVQVGELQNQLTEKLALLETRNKEVQALNSKVTELADRLDRSEVALEQARATVASEIEQIRQQSQSELTARQEEIERKVEGLQDREAALYAAEQNFKVEIDALRTEVVEKRFLLENRTDQLVRVKVERDELQERIADLESARQAEKEARQKAEQEGERTRIEMDKLWDELGPKERLEERPVAVNDLNQNFQGPIASLPEPIGSLPIELSERQVVIEDPKKGFLLGEPTLTETQKEKLNRLEQLLETIKADNEKRLTSPHNSKWRFSLSRKRRWKS
ncbi:MAG TPA: hypothetical protein VEG60_21840, partial [Candidatus Binatia bacterium]|nr:hypothetical protein [Candidatus Binatia bacterium]